MCTKIVSEILKVTVKCIYAILTSFVAMCTHKNLIFTVALINAEIVAKFFVFQFKVMTFLKYINSLAKARNAWLNQKKNIQDLA